MEKQREGCAYSLADEDALSRDTPWDQRNAVGIGLLHVVRGDQKEKIPTVFLWSQGVINAVTREKEKEIKTNFSLSSCSQEKADAEVQFGRDVHHTR